MALSERSASPAAGTGPWTRAGIGASVVLVIAIAAACAVLATWLAARPGLYARIDVTREKRNTLDPALAEILTNLPGQAQVELFLRDLDEPLTSLSREVAARLREFLFVASSAYPQKLQVVDHDLRDVARASARMQDLDLREANVALVSLGERRALLRVWGDIARLDPGNPDPRHYVPPSLASFRPDEALAVALKRVSVGQVPRILFATGHGERDPRSEGERSLGFLRRALASDGFEVAAWDPAAEPAVPGDCAVLAIVDPEQPLGAETCDAVELWVRAGGRLFAASSSRFAAREGPGTLADLLDRLGIVTLAGFVAQPFRAPSGVEVTGDPNCANLVIGPEGLDPRQPITEGLFRARRTLRLPLSRAFQRGPTERLAAEDGVLIDLVRAGERAWVDLPGPNGLCDWRYSPGESSGRLPLCVAGVYRVAASNEGDVRAARVVALGSPDAVSDGWFATNADFALNAFNWLVERDWRVAIAPRTDEPTHLDVRGSNALTTVQRTVMYAMPGLCAALGLLLYWRRRSR